MTREWGASHPVRWVQCFFCHFNLYPRFDKKKVKCIENLQKMLLSNTSSYLNNGLAPRKKLQKMHFGDCSNERLFWVFYLLLILNF